ncbi:hypothetical protein HG530_015580 [Fusarium avenaceum]|nr:hypothetical protein HG530_015580 [Fusarium avenaceum]
MVTTGGLLGNEDVSSGTGRAILLGNESRRITSHDCILNTDILWEENGHWCSRSFFFKTLPGILLGFFALSCFPSSNRFVVHVLIFVVALASVLLAFTLLVSSSVLFLVFLNLKAGLASWLFFLLLGWLKPRVVTQNWSLRLIAGGTGAWPATDVSDSAFKCVPEACALALRCIIIYQDLGVATGAGARSVLKASAKIELDNGFG